ncbi:MAG: DUF6131 family protein [Acidimicrobiales bacterium]|jgi:hypothetical protein
MITLGVLFSIFGLFSGNSALWVLGLFLLVIGAVLWLLGAIGLEIGGRRHYY